MYTNKTNIPLSLAVWLTQSDYDKSDDTKTISATTLLKPIKSIVLGLKAEGASSTDLSELIQSRMGTSIHTAIEVAWKSSNLKSSLEALGCVKAVRDRIVLNPKPKELVEGSIPVYMELRTTKEINGWKVTRKFDYVCDGMLEDFKSTSVHSYINQSNKDKYIQQASIYRWLNPEIITQDIFKINYIFTDYSSVKAKQETNYPKSRILTQEFTLMSINETERFIKDKLNQIDKYLDKPEEAPNCTDEELWVKPSVFKYYRNKDKLERSTKNFDSYWEANQRYIEDGSTGIVKEVKGEVKFCSYCPARSNCKQATSYINEGRLII